MFAAGVSCSIGLHFMTAAQFHESWKTWKTLTGQYGINNPGMFSVWIPDFMSLQTIGWERASRTFFNCILYPYISLFLTGTYIFVQYW